MFGYCKNTGLELNDLIQEGMLGLNLAMNSFDEERDASFYTYAKMCIERKIITQIVASRRLKHKVLNDSLSLESTDGNNIEYVFDRSLTDNSYNPEEILFNAEDEKDLVKEVGKVLTDFEIQVFELKINGFDYKEIAEILDKDIKAVDNALQRIKLKIKKIKD